MNQHHESASIEIDNYETPEWLVELLRMCRESGALSSLLNVEPEQVSPELRHRYLDAASVAHSIATLRRERQRVGFVPLSFADYVNGIVKVINLPLEPILAWFGIRDLTRPDDASAKAFARFAQGIGMSLREILAHIRISFAAQIDAAPIPLLVARHRSNGGRSSQIEECEVVLSQIESDYDLPSLRELRRTEFKIRAAYQEREKGLA